MAPQPVPPQHDIAMTVLELVKSWWSIVVTSLAAFVGLFKVFEIMLTRKIKEVTGIDAIATTLESMKETQERLLNNQERMLDAMTEIGQKLSFFDGVWEARRPTGGGPIVRSDIGPPLHPIVK